MRLTLVLAVLALAVGIWIGYGSPEPAAARRTYVEPETPTVTKKAPSTESGSFYQGCVALEDGTPVADVQIFATADDSQPKSRATTDADGRYRIDGLEADAYILWARREGYGIERSPEWTSPTIPINERVDFVATKKRLCTIDVRTPDGAEADHASLRWEPRPRYSQGNWTPKLSTFALSPGKFKVHATAGPNGEWRSTPVIVPDTPDLEPIVLQLEERTGIRGKVFVPPGAKPRGLKVRIGPAHLFRPDDYRRFGKDARLRGNANSFAQLDMEPGRYLVLATLGDQRVAAKAEVTVTRGVTECELRLEAAAPTRSRVVRVTGPDGKPLTDARFGCRYKGARGGAVGPCTVAERDDGSFLVSPLNIGHETDDGTWVLRVSSRALGTIRRTFDPDDPSEFVVEFPEPANVEVEVEGASRLSGLLYVHVQPAGETDDQRGFSQSNINAEEIAQVGPVPSGEVEILLGVQQSRLFWYVARKTVVLAPGENTASIAVPQLYDVKIVSATAAAPDTGPDHRVLLRPAGKDGEIYLAYHRVPKGGSETLKRLAAGQYKLTGYIYEQKKRWERTFTVPGTSDVQIP